MGNDHIYYYKLVASSATHGKVILYKLLFNLCLFTTITKWKIITNNLFGMRE